MPMDTAKLVEGLREYWESDHWKRFLHFLLEKDGERIHHIHHWVDTCIHPESMMIALQYYFARQGWEIDREVDTFVLSPKDCGTLHGVCAKGLPHFDFNWHYKAGVPIAPSGPEVSKNPCEGWGVSYMKKFYSQFNFRPVGAKEKEAIEAWTRSAQWERAYAHCEDPRVVHVHVNVLSSIHPEAWIPAALRTFKREGWTLWDYQPCVYDVRGVETGKVVFMLSYPQQIFDICWQHDPEVIIAPSPRDFSRPGYPGFDIRTQDDLPAFLAKDDYVKIPRSALREAVL